MCGGCGSPPPSAEWYDAGVEDSARGRAQALLGLAKAAECFYGETGLKVHAQQASHSLLVRAPTGRSEIIRQFGHIGPVMEALTGRSLNPLVNLFQHGKGSGAGPR
jgi:hypothetical protein